MSDPKIVNLSRSDSDFLSFLRDPNGDVARRTHDVVTQEKLDEIKSVLDLQNIQWDEIQATYPNSTTEVYTYKLATVTVQTITVVYTNASKSLIQSVAKS